MNTEIQNFVTSTMYNYDKTSVALVKTDYLHNKRRKPFLKYRTRQSLLVHIHKHICYK